MNKSIPLFILLFSQLSLFSSGGQDFSKYFTGEAAFTENKGQILDMNGQPVSKVLACYSTRGLNVYITTEGVTYVMQQSEPDKAAKPHPVFIHEQKSKIHYSRVDVILEGASISNSQLQFSDETSWESNYYKSADGKGQLAVPHYRTLTVKNIYPGIDWVWKCSAEGKLEYDYVVHPGADPDMIKMNYKYADLKPSGNKLRITSKYGTLVEGPLQANNDGRKVEIAYRFNEADKAIKFNIGKRDANRDLIIDPPLALEWSALFGGIFNSGLRGVTTDALGYAYLVGYTNAPNFPTYNPGGSAYFDGTLNGNTDAVILKIDTNEVLKWSTFLGGPNDDYANSVSTDAAGHIFVTGSAQTGFPIMYHNGAYNQSHCDNQDAFITAFDAGLNLVWSTYYGGNNMSEGLKVNAKGSNGVFVAGYTTSTTDSFPVSTLFGSAYQQNTSTGVEAFILQFDYSNWQVDWATEYGGSGDDYATSVTTDSLSNVVVCGFTSSADFPVLNPGNCYFQALGGGNDGFILRFRAGIRKSASYFGGSKDDYFTDVATGTAGSMIFSGRTNSLDFPTMQRGLAYYQASLSGGIDDDALVVQCDNNLKLLWSTYYGGAETDVATAVTTDANGRIYLTGFTFSTNFPLDSPRFAGAYYQPTNHGESDGFIAGFSSLGLRFWSTYKGDSCYEYPNDIAYDNHFNKLYIVGDDLLGCESLPDSGQVHNGTSIVGFCWAFNGGITNSGNGGGVPGCYDVSVSDITTPCPGQCTGHGIANFSGGTPPYNIVWSDQESTDTAMNLCDGLQWVEVADAAGCVGQSQFETKSLTINFIFGAPISCSGYGLAEVSALGGTPLLTYKWSNGVLGEYDNVSVAGNYTVTVQDSVGCSAVAGTYVADVDTPSGFSIQVLQYPTCGQDNGVIAAFYQGVPVPVTWELSPGGTIYGDTITAGFDTVYYIEGAFGCGNGTGYIVHQEFLDSIVLDPNFTRVNQICPGLLSGSIQLFLDPDFDNSPYFPTYQWSNGATGASISNLSPGNYSVIITDYYGCTASFSFIINFVDTNYSITTGSTPSACNPYTGMAWVDISNGTPPFYTYWLQTGAQTDTITSQLPGTYEVEVQDSFNCLLYQTTVIASIDSNFADNLFYTNCASGSGYGHSLLGYAQVSPMGVGPFNVLWSTGATGDSVYDLQSGNYSVIVTDSVGCQISDGFNIQTVYNIQYNSLVAYFNCSDQNSATYVYQLSGAAYLQIDTGGGSLTTVYPDQFTGIISGSIVVSYNTYNSGQYPVFEAYINGSLCPLDTTLGLNSYINANPIATINIYSQAVCQGDSNTSLQAVMTDVYIQSNSSGYTAFWESGDTTIIESNLGVGTYSVTTTDEIGCTTSTTIVLYPTDSVVIDSFSVTEPVCQDSSNGSITVVPGGGSGFYYYFWSSNSYYGLGPTDSLLPAGNYTCTVTDLVNGCSVVQSFNVPQPGPLTIAGNFVQNVGCVGENDGSITLVIGGGSGVYTYQWSNNQFSATDTALQAENYTCTITDAGGCGTLMQSDSITAPMAMLLYVVHSDVSCYGYDNGFLAISATGGTPGYYYQWSNNVQASLDTLLPPGYYICTVTDFNGCTALFSDSITQPTLIEVALASLENVTCFAGDNGSIQLSVSGGTPPYSFDWSNIENSIADTDLTAATYNCSISDANGCPANASYTVTQPDSFYVVVFSTNPKCFDSADGGIELIANGGNGNYTYRWSNNANGSTVGFLPTGFYSCTISDGDNCMITEGFYLSQPDSLYAVFTAQAPVCGSASGYVQLDSAFGGTTPYALHWANGDTTTGISNISAGVYELTITDNNGCIYTFSDSVSCITGIGNIYTDNIIEIYPNPASTLLHIRVSAAQDYFLQLHDITGRLIQTIEFNASAVLDVAELPRGVYLADVRAKNNSGALVVKVVLQ